MNKQQNEFLDKAKRSGVADYNELVKLYKNEIFIL